MPDLVVGSIPRGEDYFGREDLIEGLWSRLEKDNVLLAAPRRFGKTGAMFRLLDQPRAPYRPIYIDVEDITTAADFMIELLAALLRDQHFSRVLRELWQGTKEFGVFLRDLPAIIDLGGLKIELREHTEVGKDWSAYGQRVMDLLARNGPPLLLLIDEFAIMASSIVKKQGRDELARFLRWFRSARLAPQTQTRFVLGSSVNLISTLDGLGLVDTVNDLAIEVLQPFSVETSKGFIRAIFAGRDVELDADVENAITEVLGTPIPYLLAVLLTAIFDRHRATNRPVSVEMVHAAFEEDLLGGATSAVFHHYRSRLDEYYDSKDARTAKAFLGLLSRADQPVERDTLFHLYLKSRRLTSKSQHSEDFLALLNKLENDFYIVTRDGRCSFYSRVLAAWWKARFGFLAE